MSTKMKLLTVRLPLDLHQAVSEIAKRRQISLNALIQESLSSIMQMEDYTHLYEAFGQLGEDKEESDVEFAFHAQREAISRGDA